MKWIIRCCVAWNLFMDLTYDSRINILLNILQNVYKIRNHMHARSFINNGFWCDGYRRIVWYGTHKILWIYIHKPRNSCEIFVSVFFCCGYLPDFPLHAHFEMHKIIISVQFLLKLSNVMNAHTMLPHKILLEHVKW